LDLLQDLPEPMNLKRGFVNNGVPISNLDLNESEIDNDHDIELKEDIELMIVIGIDRLTNRLIISD
jgi:hypothetical protein